MPETSFAVLTEIGTLAMDDGNEIKFSVDSYKGHKYVSVRKYLKTDTYSGPTKAGITLSPEIVSKINTALAAMPADYKEVQEGELGKYAKKQGLSIVFRISSFMGSKGIDLRQWQEDDTYTGWTKKGIRLPIEKLDDIKQLFVKMNTYFEENK